LPFPRGIPEKLAGDNAAILPGGDHAMSNVESIQKRIKELSPEELAAFRAWFIEFDAQAWDRQFESDVKAGKLDSLAERALRDHASSGHGFNRAENSGALIPSSLP